MTTATIHARGMATQLDRVNHSPSRLLERIADLERENARLRESLRTQGQLLADLFPHALRRDARAELAEYAPSVGAHRDAPSAAIPTLMHNGRPAASAAQIARQHRVNISNVYRQLQRNKLQGAFVNGHWIVYLDQCISFKSYRRKL